MRKKMKRADCVAMTDAIQTQKQYCTSCQKIIDRARQAKGNSNVSIATADWKCEIPSRSVSLMRYMLCITYINKNNLWPAEIESVSHGSKV